MIAFIWKQQQQCNCSPILEGKGALAEAGRSGVLLGDAHGVAVELLGQIATEGQAVREAEEARPEVPDDGGAVGLFLGLCGCERSDIETKEVRKGEL